MFVFNYWKDIAEVLKDYFQSNLIINPLFDEKALIKLDQGDLEGFIEAPEKWQSIGPFRLKFEKWDKFKHSWPLMMKGFGGCISNKNLPLDYWRRKTFEAVMVGVKYR